MVLLKMVNQRLKSVFIYMHFALLAQMNLAIRTSALRTTCIAYSDISN